MSTLLIMLSISHCHLLHSFFFFPSKFTSGLVLGSIGLPIQQQVCSPSVAYDRFELSPQYIAAFSIRIVSRKKVFISRCR